MTIDKPEHQQLLIELIKAASFPGHMIELAAEVKMSVERAAIGEQSDKLSGASPC